MTKEKAIKVLAYLKEKNIGWCFVDGVVVDADVCNKMILTPSEYEQMKEYNNR